ncbi:MAG TPA: hypothetical protein VIM11_24865 [Tepidisphaeraceae bacterium]|jgi:hypothetical protein
MPVRKFTPTRTLEQNQLVDRLAAEWQSVGSTASEPVIIEEPDSKGDVIHVYVVWTDWAQLDREKRGDVIMEAAERVKPMNEVLKITIAFGLTPDEADRFNLKWR